MMAAWPATRGLEAQMTAATMAEKCMLVVGPGIMD